MSVTDLSEKKKAKTKQCSYCGLVPESKHPDYTCPRLMAASWDSDGGSVSFVDPIMWDSYKARLTSE